MPGKATPVIAGLIVCSILLQIIILIDVDAIRRRPAAQTKEIAALKDEISKMASELIGLKIQQARLTMGSQDLYEGVHGLANVLKSILTINEFKDQPK